MRGDFTLSYHYYSQKDRRNHLELFLDIDGASPLETWRAYRGDGRRFSAAPAHRRIYLTYAGVISNGRGRLRIVRRGKFVDRRTRCPRSSMRMEARLIDDRRTRCPRRGDESLAERSSMRMEARQGSFIRVKL